MASPPPKLAGGQSASVQVDTTKNRRKTLIYQYFLGKIGSANRTLVRTDIEFGGENGKAPLTIVGKVLNEEIERRRFRGIFFKDAYGLTQFHPGYRAEGAAAVDQEGAAGAGGGGLCDDKEQGCAVRMVLTMVRRKQLYSS
jgi:hypothetical protein